MDSVQDWIRNRTDALQERLGFGEDPEAVENQSLLSQFNEATTLTRTQRLLGFLVCFGMGTLLSFLAPLFILRPVKLATTLSLGNALSIGSMMFLAGPAKQCATMFDERRRGAAALYLASLALTLVAAFAVRSRALCLLCIAVQYFALAWYSLSYVPFAQAYVLRALGRGGAPPDEL